jgi:hypothetical protein
MLPSLLGAQDTALRGRYSKVYEISLLRSAAIDEPPLM